MIINTYLYFSASIIARIIRHYNNIELFRAKKEKMIRTMKGQAHMPVSTSPDGAGRRNSKDFGHPRGNLPADKGRGKNAGDALGNTWWGRKPA